jgi:hypothetical protein
VLYTGRLNKPIISDLYATINPELIGKKDHYDL